MTQTMFAFKSMNPLWGRTCNPWLTAHTAGDSLDGEGVLLTADGVTLSVGLDVGGSIRIPSRYCGIFGLKLGDGRVALTGSVGVSFGIRFCQPVLTGLLAGSFVI
jgi:amidase